MEPEPPDPYDVLELPPTAPQAAIVASYRRLVKRLHPDVAETGDREAFIRVQAAFRQIGDAERRAAFELARRRPAAKTAWRTGEAALGFTRAVTWRAPRVLLPLLAVATVLALAQVVVILVRPAVQAVPPPVRTAQVGGTPIAGTPIAGILAAAEPVLRDFPAADHFVGVGPALFFGDGKLEAFTPVALLRPAGRDGRVWVRRADGTEGAVDAARLQAGNARAAFLAACLHAAGPAPRSGDVLVRRRAGPARLAVENRDDRAAVVKLRDAAGATLAAMYLAPRAAAVLAGLPEERVRVDYALGDVWSAACGRFTAGMHALALPGTVLLAGEGRVSLPAPGSDIADDAFARD